MDPEWTSTKLSMNISYVFICIYENVMILREFSRRALLRADELRCVVGDLRKYFLHGQQHPSTWIPFRQIHTDYSVLQNEPTADFLTLQTVISALDAPQLPKRLE